MLPFIPLDRVRKTAHESVPTAGNTVLSGRHFHKPIDLVHGRSPASPRGGAIPLDGTPTSPHNGKGQPAIGVCSPTLPLINHHPALNKFDVATGKQEGELKHRHQQEREQFAGEFVSPLADDNLDDDQQERAFEAKLKVGLRLLTKQKIERNVFHEDRAIARRGLEFWVIAGAVSAPDTDASGAPATVADPEEVALGEVDRAQPQPEAAPLSDIIGTVLTGALAPEQEAVAEPEAGPTSEADRAAEPALYENIGAASIRNAADEPQAEVVAVPEEDQKVEPDRPVEPEAEQTTEPDRAAEPAPLAKVIGSASIPDASAEPGPEPIIEPEAEQTAECEAESAPLGDVIGEILIPDAEPKPAAVVEEVAEPDRAPEPEAVVEPEAQQVAEPDRAPEPEAVVEPETQQVGEPNQAPEPEPEAVVEPEAEQITEPDHAPEPESEPAPAALGDLIGSVLGTSEVPEPEVLAEPKAEQTAEQDRAPEPEPEQEPAPVADVPGAISIHAAEPEAVVDPEAEQTAAPDRAAETAPAPLGDIKGAVLRGPEPVAETVAEPDRAGDTEPEPALGSLGDVIRETLTGEVRKPVDGDFPAGATVASSPAPQLDLTPKRGKRIRKKYKPGDLHDVSIQTDHCLEDEAPGELWLECETADEWPVDEPSSEKATPERPIDRFARALAETDRDQGLEASPGEPSATERSASENSGSLHDRLHSTCQTDPVAGLPDLQDVLSSQNQSLIDDGTAPV